MHFDARAAKLLQAGQHLAVGGCPGLRLVASATLKTWVYRYRSPDDGKLKQLSIGHWPAMPVQASAAAWMAMRAQRSAGIDPSQARRDARQAQIAEASGPVEPNVYTVRRLVGDYIAGHINMSRKPAGALAARRALAALLDAEPAFAARAANSIKRADAFDVIDARKARPTAAAKLRSLLGAAWDYALDAGRIDGDVPNWWRLVLKGRLRSRGKIIGGAHAGRQRRVLTPAEVGELLVWLPNMHTLGRDAVQLYLWTCARGSEILAMRPEHVAQEPDGWWWTVPKLLTKNAGVDGAMPLRVPLLGRALEIVRRRMGAVGKSGWLFEDVRGEQYTQPDFSTYIYHLQPYSSKVARRQGAGLVLPVTGWTPHNLRRTGRTMLAALGCLDEIGEAIIGHMPPNIVGVYNEYTYDAERRLWLGRLAAHLEQIERAALDIAPLLD